MKKIQLINRDNGQTLALEVRKAHSFAKRLRGLLFTKTFPAGCALHIEPCRSVHTFFMSFTIDVLHLDAANSVVGVETNLEPGKFGKAFRRTASVIELPAGIIAETGTKVGHAVHFIENEKERL